MLFPQKDNEWASVSIIQSNDENSLLESLSQRNVIVSPFYFFSAILFSVSLLLFCYVASPGADKDDYFCLTFRVIHASPLHRLAGEDERVFEDVLCVVKSPESGSVGSSAVLPKSQPPALSAARFSPFVEALPHPTL